jgi:nucleotide-binding universal stress UspA family protein
METAAVLTGVPFRTVVCALDLSARSKAVLDWSAGFAHCAGASLSALYVTPEVVPTEWGYYDREMQDVLRTDAEERLMSLLKAGETQARVRIVTGAVAGAVRAVAQSEQADLVVIGRHSGTSLLGRLRDTAYAIIRESPCPVVSV